MKTVGWLEEDPAALKDLEEDVVALEGLEEDRGKEEGLEYVDHNKVNALRITLGELESQHNSSSKTIDSLPTPISFTVSLACSQ